MWYGRVCVSDGRTVRDKIPVSTENSYRYNALTLLPATVFATFASKGVKGISRVLEHTATEFQRLHVFGVKLSNGDTSDFVGHRCKVEIQDSQVHGSTNNFAGFTDTHVVPKIAQGFVTMYETSKCPAIMADATSCRKSKMAAN